MEEDQYRATYREFNPTRCAFEKAILSRRAKCPHAHKFCLAEREGVACQEAARQPVCNKFLALIREKALFALKLTQLDGQLPHAKEVRIQLGSLEGLQQLTEEKEHSGPLDIASLLQLSAEPAIRLEELPIDHLIQNIARFEGRRKSARRK